MLFLPWNSRSVVLPTVCRTKKHTSRMSAKLSYSWEELASLHCYLVNQGFSEGEVNVMIEALGRLQKMGETEQFFTTEGGWLHFTFDEQTIKVQKMTNEEFLSYLKLKDSIWLMSHCTKYLIWYGDFFL